MIGDRLTDLGTKKHAAPPELDGSSIASSLFEYIRDQVRHHARKSFRQEYLQFLKKFEIQHDERYIFKPVEEK